jgi:DNA-binding NarL/FixJ family response regulator
LDRFEEGGAVRGIRLLVVDARDLDRHGLLGISGALDDVREVNGASHVGDALQRLRDAGDHPDVVIAGSDLPGCDRLAQGCIETEARLLLLIPSQGAATLTQATRLPANGYLLRDDLTVHSLQRAVLGVVAGDLPLPDALSRHLLCAATRRDHCVRPLTTRECEVLSLVASGLNNRQVATRLSVTSHAVKHHVSNILLKTNSSTRAQAVAVAAEEGLLRTNTAQG